MDSIITDSYAVHFNETAYAALHQHLQQTHYSKLFILTDENTKEFCLPSFKCNLGGLDDAQVFSITAGEIHKNIATCTKVWQWLSDKDADRKSLLLNLGGGVVTDLGGFVASTFKRGINFINVPTSLLAMVDASVGGKTGVDLGALKNQIGVINQPKMVLVISDFLKTLDERQLNSGYAEMLKHGLIRNRGYWEHLKTLDGYDALDAWIYASVQIKNEIVLQDPTEQHLRKSLNFGHTLGHAVESFFLESKDHELLLHGEAIAVGMVMEAYLSYKACGLSKADLDDIRTTFLNRYKKVDFEGIDFSEIITLLQFDKKNSHGKVNFALLETIGHTVIDVQISNEVLQDALAYYKD
ncbi:3-dehydroquinate synthase [Arenibacter sp. GZD96]|uniref:3-dehydroquinate synthase n=1 Tax=Aurantibrevibacter litoralis TaxID=3106030 RepID=UPI002AFF04B0|nr:3-dehydroquinate synthase [Arenibacter sp. GZD-96]MEA1785379.1 3-dehydroquinate synthase [Arenibacter sp. GZD-96]